MAHTGQAAATSSTGRPHESLRMDDLLKARDPFYVSQRVREQNYGQNKTLIRGPHQGTATFTNVGREKHFPGISLDMSPLPMPWYDNYKGDKREGSYKLPSFGEINTDHLEIFKNDQLQLPSQRKQEQIRLKEGIQQWRSSRKELFDYKKKQTVLECNHKAGILGIDGPTRPETELYREQYQANKLYGDAHQQHADRRAEFLGEKNRSSEALREPYAENLPDSRFLPRSIEIPLQRKDVHKLRHPYRFFDTYSRLWPTDNPSWDPVRASYIRSHEIRDRHYDIITQADNSLLIKTA